MVFILRGKLSEYYEVIPQSHNADPPTAERGRAIEHLQDTGIIETIKEKHSAFSSQSRCL